MDCSSLQFPLRNTQHDSRGKTRRRITITITVAYRFPFTAENNLLTLKMRKCKKHEQVLSNNSSTTTERANPLAISDENWKIRTHFTQHSLGVGEKGFSTHLRKRRKLFSIPISHTQNKRQQSQLATCMKILTLLGLIIISCLTLGIILLFKLCAFLSAFWEYHFNLVVTHSLRSTFHFKEWSLGIGSRENNFFFLFVDIPVRQFDWLNPWSTELLVRWRRVIKIDWIKAPPLP